MGPPFDLNNKSCPWLLLKKTSYRFLNHTHIFAELSPKTWAYTGGKGGGGSGPPPSDFFFFFVSCNAKKVVSKVVATKIPL